MKWWSLECKIVGGTLVNSCIYLACYSMRFLTCFFWHLLLQGISLNMHQIQIFQPSQYLIMRKKMMNIVKYLSQEKYPPNVKKWQWFEPFLGLSWSTIIVCTSIWDNAINIRFYQSIKPFYQWISCLLYKPKIDFRIQWTRSSFVDT